MSLSQPIAALDVGNTRAKLGLFRDIPSNELPVPFASTAFSPAELDAGQISLVMEGAENAVWWVSSVNRPFSAKLIEWLHVHCPLGKVQLMTHQDFPIGIDVRQPERVGIDRLAAAVGANRMRQPNHAAIAIDVGSAIKVDLVSASGAFSGGAILPGLGMSARAMHQFTAQLPELQVEDLSPSTLPDAFNVGPPVPVGRSTVEAMQAGLYWGAVGGIRELIARMSEDAGAEIDIFLAGGAAPMVAELLGPNVKYVPHLVLSGIAIAAAAGDKLSRE